MADLHAIANTIALGVVGGLVLYDKFRKPSQPPAGGPVQAITVAVPAQPSNPSLPAQPSSPALVVPALPGGMTHVSAEVDELRAEVAAMTRAAAQNARAIAQLRRDEDQRSQEDAEFRAEVGEMLLSIRRKIREQRRDP